MLEYGNMKRSIRFSNMIRVFNTPTIIEVIAYYTNRNTHKLYE